MPKPYYQKGYVTIYYGDCREILPQLTPYDLTLTDFPYGNDTKYDNYSDTRKNLKDLINTTLPLIRQQSKRSLITCGVGNLYLFPKPDWILLWISSAGAGSGKWGFCCWQPIIAYGNDPYLAGKLGRQPDTIFSNEPAIDTLHPCPKPLSLWKQVLARGSVNTNDVIVDCFMGTGTTLEAAKALNRHCIGIDISEQYCELAAKRCSQEVMELGI